MATTKSPNSTVTSALSIDADAGGEYVHALNEKVLATAKQTGHVSLDAYEKTLTTMLDFGQHIARTWQPNWATRIADAQTDFVRSMSSAYIAVAREALK